MRVARPRLWGALAGLALAVLLGLGLALARARLAPLLSVGAGLEAGHLCSGVFVGGRSAEAVRREELRGLHPLLLLVPAPSLRLDPRAAGVDWPAGTDALLGLRTRRAAYRAGFGCAVLPPGAPASAASAVPTVDLPEPEGDPARLPWPRGAQDARGPLPPGADRDALEAVLDAAFERPEEGKKRTTAALVVHEGRIVAERYAPGWGPQKAYRTWSTAKSLTSALVGVLVRRGELALDAPAPVPEWGGEGDRRGSITVRHLLHMSSGLEGHGAWTPEAYWGGIDSAEAAVARRLEAEPGTRWRYANFDTLALVRAMRAALGSRERYLAFPHRALLDRVGMHHTVPETDPYGNFVLSSQVYTTPRDLARFGLLYLAEGVWQGERLLPEGWVAMTREPAPATAELPEEHRAHRSYGAHFWLYGRHPRLPEDAFSTGGARGQHATVVPSRELVVVRTGLDPIEGSAWDQPGFVADVLEALGLGVSVPEAEAP